MTSVIYVLHGTTKAGKLEIFYVGRTTNPSSRRYQHRRDCADLLNSKPAYEWARQAYNGVFELSVLVEESDTNTEQFWIAQLRREGHPLQNVSIGDSKTPKARRMSELNRLFRQVNKQALGALNNCVLPMGCGQKLDQSQQPQRTLDGNEATPLPD
ncbi:MAG: hypothetical protein V4757_06765 [Pseudomonadota bacterium]